jgi:2-polyprenyl-3-methyl-5-hydroxy-6-metoxy-1,4-benzoquinol methylase
MSTAVSPSSVDVTGPPSSYDRQYALSHSVPADNWLFDSLIELLAPQPGWCVLDVGCNTGELTARLAALQCRTLGIDINTDAIALARQRFPQLAFEVTVLSALTRADFDAIIASHVIEHLAEPNDFLREARKRLKPTGRLVIATPNRHAWLHKLANRLRSVPFFDDPTHRHLFAPRELERLVRNADFDSVKVLTRPLYFPLANHLPQCWRAHIPTLGMGDHLFAIAAAPSAQTNGMTGKLNRRSA